ncbi:MAG: hypothetical protein JSS39_08690 [Nitrospira sp.]|nr:hypothetical protein [Nitrospira sp.]
MSTDRAASLSAWTLSERVQACRSGESAITAEVFVNNARWVSPLGSRAVGPQEMNDARYKILIFWPLASN